MKLILTRKSSNPTCTLGELVSEDGQLTLVSKEGKIPKDRQSYIMRCLPPGEYPMEIEYCCIMYKDKPIRAYWPVLKKVPWFPHAGFFTGTAASANKGRIKLGMESTDEYTIIRDDEACQQMVRWAKRIYDENSESRKLENSESRNLENSEDSNLGNSESRNLENSEDSNLGNSESRNLENSENSAPRSSEVSNCRSSELPSLTLEVIQPEDQMQFSNLSEHDYRIAEQVAKEKAEQEALANDLYGNL